MLNEEKFELMLFNMERIKEEDVPILDRLLERLVKIGDFIIEDLPPLSGGEISDIPDLMEKEYRDCIEILERCELIKIDRLATGAIGIVHSIPHSAKLFYEKGGFSEAYKKQQTEYENKKESENLALQKLRWDVKISRFQAKTKLWPLIISIISLGIASVALFQKCK